MAASLVSHYRNIKAQFRFYIAFSVFFFIAFFIILLFFIFFIIELYLSPSLDVENALSIAALFISCFAIFISLLFTTISNSHNYWDYLSENIIKQKKEELSHITESIEMFYLPLQDVLTTSDEPVPTNSRKRKIVEINGHKYLAEPRVRCVFEKYNNGDEGANRESRKLLELVTRDIELLQHRYNEIKNELNEE